MKFAVDASLLASEGVCADVTVPFSHGLHGIVPAAPRKVLTPNITRTVNSSGMCWQALQSSQTGAGLCFLQVALPWPGAPTRFGRCRETIVCCKHACMVDQEKRHQLCSRSLTSILTGGYRKKCGTAYFLGCPSSKGSTQSLLRHESGECVGKIGH